MRKLLAGSATAALVALSPLLAAGAASAAPPLPVPGNFLAGVAAELLTPGGTAPGSNDWGCRPRPEHPEPVILVHGTTGNRQTNWATLSPLLANQGYCVYALTYGVPDGRQYPADIFGGLNPMERSAGQLALFVDQVLAATGARKVNLVGHSQGTLMPNYYVKNLGGAAKVDRYVSLAPLWNGSQSFVGSETTPPQPNPIVHAVCSDVLCPVPGYAPVYPQMATGSAFLAGLHAGGLYAPGVKYTNITTTHEDVVLPYSSGNVPGPETTNIVLQDGCDLDRSDHLAIVSDPIATTHVLNALDPAHPRPVPCFDVPPLLNDAR